MVSIILSHPQMGENIGATARAMLNFGLTDLRLVAPRDGWPSAPAIANAAGALEIMPPIKIFETTAEAIKDLHFVLGTTARPRDMVKPLYTPESAVTESQSRLEQDQKTGFLFGGERAGLSNDEVSLCHGIITIPTNPDFASLNLAQSVLLLGYEWIKSEAPDNMGKSDLPPPATNENKDVFIERLDKDLDAMHFYRSEGSKSLMRRNIRNIFSRMDITEGELNILHGMLSALRGNKKVKDNK